MNPSIPKPDMVVALFLLGSTAACATAGNDPPTTAEPTLVEDVAARQDLAAGEDLASDPWRENGAAPAVTGDSDVGDSVVGRDLLALDETTPADGSLIEETLVEETLDEGDQGLSTREAFERAIAWSTEGVRLYQAGDHEGARKNLSDARIVLLEADLPEVLQERGLAILSSTLPARFGHRDLEALAQRLELELAPAADLPERERIEREVLRILHRFGAPTPRPAYMEIFVDEVQHYIDYYRGNGRKFFERAFERKHKYWPTIDAVFSARGLPTELGYMALVESGFNPRAYSSAKARGVWQFISSTGKRYGLRQTEDFYDSVKATEAAAEYLLDLIGIFGTQSPFLAVAAYNAGENRIQGCLRGIDDPFGKRTFWEIRPCLARETREYVPRIVAAAVIGSDPPRFGFDVLTEAGARERFDVVSFPSVTRLSEIARTAGVTVADLRVNNTDLRSNATSTPARNFPIYVPKGGGVRLTQSLRASPTPVAAPPASASDSQPAARTEPSSTPVRVSTRAAPPEVTRRSTPRAVPSGAAVEYVARRGDSLGEIASRFGVTVSDVKDWNPVLRQRVLYRGDRLQIYPKTSQRLSHRVERGDTLSEIAERYGVSHRDLASWNGLRSPYTLKIGQRLVVYSGGALPSIRYTVRKGNSLSTIADLFAVRIRDIKSWNNLGSNRLRVGQRLNIQPRRPVQVENYKVRRGDTVAKIAGRFGVPVRSVLTANGLGARSLIRPGERLVVYVNS